MNQKFFANQFSTAMHLQLFKQILTYCLIVSLFVYAAIRLIFFDIPFEWMEEIMLLVKPLFTGASFAACISGTFILADAIQLLGKKLQAIPISPVAKKTSVAMLLVIIAASACNAQPPLSGTVKDNTTGLTAVYKNIKPGKVLLVMNDEVIHHSDIPIGENFILINKDVKGLTIKNGKVSVGCSLTIKDKTGKIMLQSDDLFNRNDTFQKDSVTYLKCTVSTGKPMQWEEKYNVAVVFWDKYGTGKIENKVTIRCIDIP
jgi:hypothetical protein